MVRTDADGRATVEVKLPDNLTTWRLRGRGVTADTLVGEGTVDVVSTLDLLVRTVAPRFFVKGDRATLSVVVHNNTDAAGGGRRCSWRRRGWTSTASRRRSSSRRGTRSSWTGRSRSRTSSRSCSAPARRRGRPVGRDRDHAAGLHLFHARGGGHRRAPGRRRTSGWRRSCSRSASIPTQGELTVQVDPSLAAGMRDGLDYLEHYPYECVEQTVSRWLPNVLTYKALQDLGIENPELEAEAARPGGQGLAAHLQRAAL